MWVYGLEDLRKVDNRLYSSHLKFNTMFIVENYPMVVFHHYALLGVVGQHAKTCRKKLAL